MHANEALLHNWFYGNYYVRVAASALFAYLLASIPLRAVVAWFFAGIRGSVASTARGFVPLGNALKAFLPVLLATHGGGIRVGLLAAVAAVIADCWSPWLRFRGDSNGVAAQFGALCAVCWPAAVFVATVWFCVSVSTNYAVMGGVTASFCSILPLFVVAGVPGGVCGVLLLLIAAAAWGPNLDRLLHDREATMRREGFNRPALPERAKSVVRLSGQAVQSL